MNKEKDKKPDWVRRSKYLDHKPDFTPTVPETLEELGDVFFPIPRGRKGWNYPHHIEDCRYRTTSETLNAYFEQGWGYGIACANDLAVVDIDEKAFVKEIAGLLPETAYQWTGSREGVHFFYHAPGLNSRQILHYKDGEHDCDNEDHKCEKNKDGDCVKEYEWEHLGEIKCDPHGYVVGPGSVHPSGNKYGPLEGEVIEEVDVWDLALSLYEYIKPTRVSTLPDTLLAEKYDDEASTSQYDFYNLETTDVVPWLEPGVRVPHPVHGSSTGNNFMRTEDGDAFVCWRHDYGGSQGCGLNPQQLLAVEETGMDCDRVRARWKDEPRLHWQSWKRAVAKGLISYKDVPYTVIKGYGVEEGIMDNDEDLVGDLYWDLKNSIKIRMEEEYLPDEAP